MALKVLKYLGIFILILLIVGYFLPKKSHMEHSKVMPYPKEKVFALVNDIKSWEQWNVWNLMDTNMKTTYGDITSGTGATSAWESKVVGNGSMKYLEVVDNESIKTQLNFMEHGSANSEFKFEKVAEGTKVTWSFDTDMSNAGFLMKCIGSYMGMMMKGELKKNFETGLNNIESILQKGGGAEQSNNLKIEVKDVPAFNAMTLTGTMNLKTIAQTLGDFYGQCGKAMGMQKLEMAGAPFAIYHEFSLDGDFKAEAGIATTSLGKDAGNVKAKEFPATKAVVGHHYGSYEATELSHGIIKAYMADNNLVQNGAPWEVYVTDPMAEKDTMKWLTEIYYPVK